MAESKVTILIPDISGFTEFMTTTELSHSSQAINILIDTIVSAVDEEYEIAEIEGDAVLLTREGPCPAKKELLDTCLRIFNGFHYQRKWLQQYTVCPCAACLAISNLALKFVVHHGPLAKIKVGRFVKQSGPEMIVAHRLLKNSINSDEYLLLSEKVLQQAADSPETIEMDWTSSSEEYASFGKVAYSFTLLDEARKKVPDPQPIQDYYTDDTSYLEKPIAANFHDVYMAIMNIPGRADWFPGLKKVEQDTPFVFVGSIHNCTFEDYQAIVSPLRMTLTDESIVYAESCEIKEMNLSLVHEFVLKRIDERTSTFATRFMNVNEAPVPEDINAVLVERMEQMTKKLKINFEKIEEA